MKKYGKKLTALLLTVCVLLTAAACGKSGGGEDSSAEQLSGTVYVPEFIKCELDVEHIDSACSDGQYIYMVAEISEEVQIPVEDTVLPEDFEASDGGRNGIAGDDIAVDGVVVGGDGIGVAELLCRLPTADESPLPQRFARCAASDHARRQQRRTGTDET